MKLPRHFDSHILLTFDDGPHPDITPRVLDQLEEFNAKAIFFVVGNRIPRAPYLLPEIVKRGHWIGNHTFTHPNDRLMNYSQYKNDLIKCQKAIFDLTGIYPVFHRPPWGQLTFASLISSAQLGFKTMNWTISSEDWRCRSQQQAIDSFEHLSKSIKARDIVLFHDEKKQTLSILELLLPTLAGKGFSLTPELNDLS